MKNKSAIYLGAAFLILLVIFIINRVSDKSVEKVRYFVEVDTSRVDYIHTKSLANGDIVLQKVNDVWRVVEPVDYLAEQRSVHETLIKFTQMKIENLATSRKEQQKTYEADDSSGVFMEIKGNGKKIAAFFMGKPSSTYRHTYFRKAGSDNVYMVEGTYKYQFDRSLKDWRNKVILDINKDSIEDFTLVYPDKAITLTREDTVWTAKTSDQEFVADKPKVEQILNYASQLRAADFYNVVEGAAPPDFSNPVYKLEVKFFGGQKQSVAFLPEDDEKKRYMVKKMDDDTIYLIYSGTANIMMKDLDNFRPAEKAEPEMEMEMEKKLRGR